MAGNDDLATARDRRRHPAERAMSFRSGTLLLVLMAQAAFGYALVDPSRAYWFRLVHLSGALLVLVLTVRLDLGAARLPFPGLRRTSLRVMARVLTLLVLVQTVSGLWFRLSGPTAALRDLHIGIGLIATLWVLALHMTCIWPSIRLGARREWEAARGAQDPDRKV